MKTISAEERRRRLGKRHHLTASATDVESVARDLVGIHSSDPVTVYLSCLARCDRFQRADLERALYDERSLVRCHGMRRTLFVVPTKMAPLLQSGCGERYIAPERRRLLALLSDQHGHDEKWLREVEDRTQAALAELGTATARDLVTRVPELETKITFGQGSKWSGSVGLSTRILFFLATTGQIVRGRPIGTWISSQYRWTPAATWHGSEQPQPPPADARVALISRWLARYGPGTFDDLKWWSGWRVGETRDALQKAGAVEVEVDGAVGFVAPGDSGETGAISPWAALLPSLDSTPMGWKERDWFLGPHRKALFDRNGNIGPTVWCNGRIVGGWAVTDSGKVRLGLLEEITAVERQLVTAKAHDLEARLGSDSFVPRFRTPLEKELLA